MQPTITTTASRFSDRVGGLALIAIGSLVVAGLVGQFEAYLMLAIGLVAVSAFVLTRDYGFAVAGGVMTGIGSAITLITQVVEPTAAAQTLMLSVGGGFAGVWLLGLAAKPSERHPWPLVPAATMLTIGTSIATRTPMLIDMALAAVATGFLAVGLVLVVRRER